MQRVAVTSGSIPPPYRRFTRRTYHIDLLLG